MAPPSPARLYDVTYTGLPTIEDTDNVVPLCHDCAQSAALDAMHDSGPSDSDCDACNGRIDLSFSPAALGIAERIIAKQGSGEPIWLAILLTPEIDALLAPVDLGS